MIKLKNKRETLASLGLSLVLMFVCMMSSCTEENAYVETKTETIKPKVLTHIEEVNTKILSEVPAKGASRGWDDWSNRQRIKVVCADLYGCYKGGKRGSRVGAYIGGMSGQPVTGAVFGAVLGGAIVGSYKSWKASPRYYEMTNDDEDSNSHTDDFTYIAELCKGYVRDGYFSSDTIIDEIIPDDLDIPRGLVATSGLSQNAIIVGKMHNLILGTLDGSIDANAGSAARMAGPSLDEKNDDEVYDALLETIANSPEFIAECRVTAESEISDDTSDSTIEDILALFVYMLENYSAECSNVAYVVGRYTEIIDQSTELTNSEKEQLKSSLSTALYSSRYWYNKIE